jgi:hypothetical protein
MFLLSCFLFWPYCTTPATLMYIKFHRRDRFFLRFRFIAVMFPAGRARSQLPKVWMVQSFAETAKPHEVLDAMRVVSFCRVYIQTLQESIDVW